MKILYIFNHPAPYKVSFLNELAENVELDVIFERTKNKNRNPLFYSEKEYKFNFKKVKLIPFGEENCFGNGIKKYIKEHHNEYNHIIMNGYSCLAEMSAIKYMVKKKIPYILMINGGIVHKDSPVKLKIKTKYISTATSYLSPNEQSSKYLTHYGADPAKIKIYPYASIHDSDIRKAPISEEIRKQLCLKYHLPVGPIFTNISQFIPRKNNMQIIEIFKNRTETLFLVGDGPERKTYEKYIRKNNITNVIIHKTLSRSQVKEVLQLSTGFITLSKEDIFGHTTIEALANGIPVISSNHVNASLEVIKNGVNGFLVSLENEAEINEAINESLKLKFEDITASTKYHTIEDTVKAVLEVLK